MITSDMHLKSSRDGTDYIDMQTIDIKRFSFVFLNRKRHQSSAIVEQDLIL